MFNTVITLVFRSDAKQIKKTEWVFDWHGEVKSEEREVYKLTTVQKKTAFFLIPKTGK